MLNPAKTPPMTRTEGLMDKVQRAREESVEELDRLLGRAPRRPELLRGRPIEEDYRAAILKRRPQK